MHRSNCLQAAPDAQLLLVADPVKDLVAVYKNPPYPIFYDVVHHSFGLVPMLANPQYYKSKFSSTVLTSLITGGCAQPWSRAVPGVLGCSQPQLAAR